MEDDDPIKKLLQQTGWSYMEILKKLEAYKDGVPKNTENKDLTKETDAKDTSNVKLSVEKTTPSCTNVTKEDAHIGNNIKDATITTPKEESRNPKEEGSSELTPNKIEAAELRNNEENCPKVDVAIDKSNSKAKESKTEKQECKDSTDHEKENVEIQNKKSCNKAKASTTEEQECEDSSDYKKENTKLQNNTDSRNNEDAKLKNSTENPHKDEELESIIQRLEKFIEENAESDNEDSYAEIYAKKSEYDNSEKTRHENSKSDEKPQDDTKASEKLIEQKSNSQQAEEENLQGETINRKPIAENCAEDKLEKNVEDTLKFEETTPSKQIAKENDGVEKIIGSVIGQLPFTGIIFTEKSEEKGVQNLHPKENSDSIVMCDTESETFTEDKLEKISSENPVIKKISNSIGKSTGIEQVMDDADDHLRDISKIAEKCSSEAELEKEQTLKPSVEKNAESEAQTKAKSVNTIKSTLEATIKKEDRLENLKSKEHNHIVEKSNLGRNTLRENITQRKLENRSVEEFKKILHKGLEGKEIVIVSDSGSEENINKSNAESESNKDEVTENPSDPKGVEEDKPKNIIRRLEKVIAQLEDNGEENPKDKELLSTELKKVSEESAGPKSVTGNLEDPAQKYFAEPPNEGIREDVNLIKTNQNISQDVVIEISVTSPSSAHNPMQSEKSEKTLKNLRSNLRNVRLRIIRKCKKTLNRKSKKKCEINPKLVQTNDIRFKLKEQLELLRTKRKTGESALVLSPTKSSGTLKFPQRNANRLNSITNTLFQKLGSGNIQALPETVNGSDSDVEVQDSDVNSECEILNKQPVNHQTGKSRETDGNAVLSEETGFMIVNVVGGYESPTHETRFDDNIINVEENSETEKNENATNENSDHEGNNTDKEFMLNGIMPTKTKDVTKIKGWKNKKFAIAHKEGQRKPSEKLLFQLKHDSSESSNQSSNLDNKTTASESPSTLLLSEKPENTNKAKSAFISDELDQYLTENSQLKISYEVPKLEAEQTITTKYIDIKFPELPQQNTQLSNTKYKDSYKPKTLAEKRKMLLEAEKPEVGDFLVGMNSKQRKDYEASVLRMRKKLIEEDVPFTRRCFMTSTSITNTHNFVIYNGRKLKVASTSNKEIIAHIKGRRRTYKQFARPCPKVHRQRKPSLLSELKSDVNRVSYDSSEWETVQIKLPKLTLEIKPQVGKRIHPKIEHLITNDDLVLNQHRVEFALSALKVKNSTTKPRTYTFPLSYNKNQNYVAMRRKCPVVDISMDTAKIIETDSEITETVTNMVNKMLDYIEIAEKTKDIIQNDTSSENDVKVDLPQPTEAITNKNWRRKRRVVHGEKGIHRTTLEMKRLNCKIVSISLDEENGETQTCTKDFCKLGCVCKSIECSSNNLFASHCGLSRCMFTCKCRYKNTGFGEKFSLPSGADIFSEGIINRLQVEAKKNLAKVEKEFTQTVIKTNNQIIVVGDSNERRRRATKMPKKYIDFVEEDPYDKPVLKKNITSESKYRSLAERSPIERRISIERIPEKEPVIEPFDEDIAANTDELKDVTRCFVKLQKHDFSGIMPFCLVHSLYKCHCKNKAVFDSSVGDRNIVACTYVTPPKSIPQLDTMAKNKLKPKTDKSFNKELYSSRTRGLATSYYLMRNKSLSHRIKLKKSAKRMQKNLEIYLRRNATKIMEDAIEASVESSKPADPLDTTPNDPTLQEFKRKRKQSLIVLQDSGNETPMISASDHANLHQSSGNWAKRELKLQRRRTKSNLKLTGQELVNTRPIGESPSTVLPGDTNNLKNEFLTLLGKKTSELRLLPWTTLAAKFQNGSFQVWYANTAKMCPLIITENGRRPTNYHCNIRLFERMPPGTTMPSDIIRWLLNKQVPLEKSVDNILLVLCLNKCYWEMCGLCEKNRTDPKTKDHVAISLIHKWNETETNSNTATNLEPPTIHLDDDEDKNLTENDQNVASDTEAMVHENLQENKKVMYCSKRRFQPKKLVSDEIDDDALKIRQVLWAPIPSVTIACKWRVIYMNVGFAYLSLSRSSYTIKYVDIMKAMKIAQNDKITVVLKSEELQKNYPHRNFGIYCVHNYMDKLFVGPYFLNENHDLDTLSYVNRILVNTSLLNEIKKPGGSGNGQWFHQDTQNNDKNLDDDVVIIQEPAPVVDLTCESDEDSPDVCKDSSDSSHFKNNSALLKSMLLTPLTNISPESEEEVAKAEKALDALLMKGQINVNKTLVQLETLKTAAKLNRAQQPASSRTSPSGRGSPLGDSAASPSRNATIAIDNQYTRDSTSESADDDKLLIDDDRLVIDEESTTNNQQSEARVAECDNVNRSKEDGDGKHLKVNRYLVTNVPGLGYISAHQHDDSDTLDVVCPITKKVKRFGTPETAIAALEKVFTNKFIRVPTTFKLQFKMLEKLENATDAPLDRSILYGYHIVGVFGVRNLLRCTATELENFGLDKLQITHMWTLFEKKLLWPTLCQLRKLLAIPAGENSMESILAEVLDKTVEEINLLQKSSALFIKEKIDLESKKVQLAEKCSKLIYHLPLTQQQLAQQELDRIVSFSNRETSLDSSAGGTDQSKMNLSEVSDPIILDDDDNDIGTLPTSRPSLSTPVTGPMKFTLTKGPIHNGTSLLSVKKVDLPNRMNNKSLLTMPFQQKDAKFVMVHQKRNASGKLVSTQSMVDLSKCTFQIKSSNSDQKMLVKEVPIKVRKDMLAATNSVLQAHQQKSLLLSSGALGNVVRTYTNNPMASVFSSVPTITKIPKLNTVISPIGNSGNSKFAIAGAPQTKKAKLVSTAGVPVAFSTSNSMATLTPMSKPPEFVLTNSTAKTTPNYIAIKEGNNLKYFQLVSETKAAGLKSVQAIQRPTSSIKISTPSPLRKIAPAPATSLLTNQKTDQ